MDAAAATAAYLDRIPASARAAAEASTNAALIAWAAGGALIVVMAWLIARTGVLTRLRAAIERDRPRPWLVSAAAAGAFSALVLVALAPLEVFVAHAVDPLGDGLIRLIGAVLLLPLIYAVARRSPRWWWVWTSGLATALLIALVWGPYALAAGPAKLPPVPPGAARDGVLRLIAEARIPAREVYVSPQDKPWADVTGVPGNARVTVSGPMLRTWSPAEIRANLAHVASHFRHHDQLALAAISALLALGGLFAIDRLLRPLARLVGAPLDKADPAGLPAAAIIAVLWLGPAMLLQNGFVRWINVRADAEALATSREADGLASGLVKDWDGEAVAPGWVARTVLYSHPPLAERVGRAMAWKASRPD